MFVCWDEDFISEVIIFFIVVKLIFKVYGCGVVFGKEFGEFEDGGEIFMVGVVIGNDGLEEVGVRGRGMLFRCYFVVGILLFVVVYRLGFGEMLDLIGNGIVGVVVEVWGDFICGCKEGGVSLVGDVEDFLVGSLLGYLDGVDGVY